jgi:hypothetical protein
LRLLEIEFARWLNLRPRARPRKLEHVSNSGRARGRAECNTGFFFYVLADEVIELPIFADEAAELVMSGGLIQPQRQAAFAAIAEVVRLAKPPMEAQAWGAGR